MTTLSKSLAQSLLAELGERFNVPLLDESCEVCASMLVDLGGITHERARRNLHELVKAGELEEHPAIWRGKRVLAYRRTER